MNSNCNWVKQYKEEMQKKEGRDASASLEFLYLLLRTRTRITMATRITPLTKRSNAVPPNPGP